MGKTETIMKWEETQTCFIGSAIWNMNVQLMGHGSETTDSFNNVS